MTVFDFLAQATFWEWLGIIILAFVAGETMKGIAAGIGGRKP